jgi:hypothetical protein
MSYAERMNKRLDSMANAAEENGFERGKEYGYRQGIIDYRRMQEKNI